MHEVDPRCVQELRRSLHAQKKAKKPTVAGHTGHRETVDKAGCGETVDKAGCGGNSTIIIILEVI